MIPACRKVTLGVKISFDSSWLSAESHRLLLVYVWTHAMGVQCTRDRQMCGVGWADHDQSELCLAEMHHALLVLDALSWAASLKLHDEKCGAVKRWLKYHCTVMADLLRLTDVMMLTVQANRICSLTVGRTCKCTVALW